MAHSRSKAFSLVELLVVLTIVTLLVSMLLPVITQARSVAQKVLCAGNFRQVSAGAFSYSADNSQCFPNLNNGSYGTLGVAGGGYVPNQGGHTIDYWFSADPFCRFTQDYLSAAWGWDTGLNLAKVPKVLACPGMPARGVKYLGPLYPGETLPTQGYHQIGQSGGGGWFVGFGSFLGLSTPIVNAQGVTVYTIRLTNARADLMKFASDDPIIVDLLSYRYDANLCYAPHGSSMYTPWGSNQGFADGSVRWYDFASLNAYYVPTYDQDRKIYQYIYNGPKGQLLKGGYPGPSGGASPPDEWFGAVASAVPAWVH